MEKNSGAVMPSSHPTYFDLLELKPHFDLDLAALEKAYLAQQRQYHPDRFVGKPEAQRQQAMQRSVDINQAYHTLKSPLSRAQYLLRLQGVHVGGERDSVKPSPPLLMEVMEWREQAEGADKAGLQSHLESMKTLISHTLHIISASYGRADWNAMAQAAMRLGYLQKTQDELAQRLRTMP